MPKEGGEQEEPTTRALEPSALKPGSDFKKVPQIAGPSIKFRFLMTAGENSPDRVEDGAFLVTRGFIAGCMWAMAAKVLKLRP